MTCLKCFHLTADFHRSERLYASARGLLSGVSDSPDSEEYTHARAQADDARMDYESTLAGLERHQREHE